jgi:hypothetical protein
MSQFRYLAIVVAAVLGAGCLGDSADESKGSIGEADKDIAARGLFTGIEGAAKSYFAYAFPTPMMIVAPPDSCETMSGVTTDTDGDGIYMDATIEIDCTTTTETKDEHIVGTRHIVDDLPELAAWAFTDEISIDRETKTGATREEVSKKGLMVATGDGPFNLKYTMEEGSLFWDRDMLTATMGDQKAWDITITPDDNDSEVVEMVIGGTWDAVVGNNFAKAVLTTPTTLKVNRSCANPIVSGTLTASYDGSDGTRAKLSITGHGCNAPYTVAYTER